MDLTMKRLGDPLDPEETEELARLLEESGRSLAFARGVFAATASAPTLLEPTQWLGLLLGGAPPDEDALRRLMALVMREYNACTECLALGVPAVPAPTDVQGVEDFCKGYIRVTQADPQWTKDADAFSLTVPFAWLAGYVDTSALASFAPEAVAAPDEYRARKVESLADDVMALHQRWAEARNLPPPPRTTRADRVGRNDPCPCGSGEKYKRCCAS